MQPKTEVKFDKKTFDRLKQNLHLLSWGQNAYRTDPGSALELPAAVGLQLTNRCNLRCHHCFQWNETGSHRHLPASDRNLDLDPVVIAKIFQETAPAKPQLYLWGGEPLCYPGWDELTQLLSATPLWTVCCTNGMDIETKIESILKISPHLVMLISIDGFADEHDTLRGKGAYAKTLRGLDLLLDLQQKGAYRGEISVNCVINDLNIPSLYRLMEFFEKKRVNTVYFCFPWYIPEATAQKMDGYMHENFHWLSPPVSYNPPSWHSYRYHLKPELIPDLLAQIEQINRRTWKIRTRFQPALEPAEVPAFISGEETPAQKRRLCLAISQRMNVLPNGGVTVCKLFPELTIGNLHQTKVSELWHSPSFRRAREILAKGLTPVCSKCVLLYLHGV